MNAVHGFSFHTFQVAYICGNFSNLEVFLEMCPCIWETCPQIERGEEKLTLESRALPSTPLHLDDPSVRYSAARVGLYALTSCGVCPKRRSHAPACTCFRACTCAGVYSAYLRPPNGAEYCVPCARCELCDLTVIYL